MPCTILDFRKQMGSLFAGSSSADDAGIVSASVICVWIMRYVRRQVTTSGCL